MQADGVVTMMDHICFKQLSVPVSRMIYGTAISPLVAGENADELLDQVLAQGITTFDTARSYGGSEAALGRWIKKRGIREKINILTKGCNPHQTNLKFTPESLQGELTESLKALQTEYVDLYCLHRDDTTVGVDVFVETLNAFKAEGKIRAFGASNWEFQRMNAANEYAYAHGMEGFSFGSPAFSLAVVVRDPWGGSVHISGKDKADARKWFADNQIPVFAYSSFARGFFSGKYRTDMDCDVTDVLSYGTCQEYVCEENMERLRRAEMLALRKGLTVGQINLAWIMGQPLICCPVFAPSTTAHLMENLKGLDVTLTPEEMQWLNLERDEFDE